VAYERRADVARARREGIAREAVLAVVAELLCLIGRREALLLVVGSRIV
jgi:hypothetical protein